MSWRNEANWLVRSFILRRLRGERLGLRRGMLGLDALKFFDGVALQAAGVIDVALEAGLGGGSVVEGLADWNARLAVLAAPLSE